MVFLSLSSSLLVSFSLSPLFLSLSDFFFVSYFLKMQRIYIALTFQPGINFIKVGKAYGAQHNCAQSHSVATKCNYHLNIEVISIFFISFFQLKALMQRFKSPPHHSHHHVFPHSFLLFFFLTQIISSATQPAPQTDMSRHNQHNHTC